MRFDLRKLPLARLGIPEKQNFAHHKSQNRVAQKLELLVILPAHRPRGLLGRPRTVRQSAEEKLRIREMEPDLLFQRSG